MFCSKAKSGVGLFHFFEQNQMLLLFTLFIYKNYQAIEINHKEIRIIIIDLISLYKALFHLHTFCIIFSKIK